MKLVVKVIFNLVLALAISACGKDLNQKAESDFNRYIIPESKKMQIQGLMSSYIDDSVGPHENSNVLEPRLRTEGVITSAVLNRNAEELSRQYHNSVEVYKFQGKSTCTSYQDPPLSSPDLKIVDFYNKVSPNVMQVAWQLGSPEEVYQYVKNQVENEVIFGATRTPERTLRTRSGSTMDKVNLLRTLFSALEIPSYIVTGEVYLTDEVAMRVFSASDRANLVNASYFFFDKYFVPDHGSALDVYRLIDGQMYWVLPHVWVRAYYNNEWRTYDPLELKDNLDLNLAGKRLSTNQQINWKNWFFESDEDGRYLKEKTPIDFLLYNHSLSVKGRYLNLNSRLLSEKRYDSVLSNLEPCMISSRYQVENSDLEYRGRVFVKDSTTGTTVMDYETSLARISEGGIFLSHSSGLRGTQTTPVSGSLELRLDREVVQQITTATQNSFKVSFKVSAPTFWSSLSEVDEFAAPYISGDVININSRAGRATYSDVDLSIESLIDEINSEEEDRFIMAKVLKLAGDLFDVKEANTAKDTYRIRGYITHPLTFSATYTKAGIVLDEGDKEFGITPLAVGIDARLSGYIYDAGEYNYSADGVKNILIATEEGLVAGSEAEATIWEELFGLRGYSANRVLQLGAHLKSLGAGYSFIEGLKFNSQGNTHISSLIDPSSQLFTHWPTIESEFGTEGNTFWSLNKEVTDPNGGAVALGYMVFRKDIYSPGIAAFNVLNYGSQAKDEGLVLEKGIDNENKKFADSNQSIHKNEKKNPIGAFGGGGSRYSEPPLEPIDGESFQNGPATAGSISSGCSRNPVDFSTGRMWHTFIDFNLITRVQGFPLQFKRTYFTLPQYQDENSWVGQGDLGKGWVHNFDTRLLDGSKDGPSNLLTMGPLTSQTLDVVWISMEGNPIVFKNTGSASIPQFEAPDGYIGSLVAQVNTYELTEKGGRKLIFKRNLNSNYNGRLIQIIEPHGEDIDVVYDSNGEVLEVSSEFAGKLSFVRGSSGKIVQIKSDKYSLIYTYTYQNEKLKSSVDFDGNRTEYAYNPDQVGTKAEGLLTEIIDSLGRKIQFEYYQNGKVFKEIEPGGAVQTYQYAPYLFQKYTRVTAPNGYTTEYRYDDKFRIRQIVYPDGGRRYQEWNDLGRIDFERDQLGGDTYFTYDSRGNRTGIKKPLDSSYRSIVYDQNFDIPTIIDPLAGGTRNLTLDPQTGDVLSVSRNYGSSSLTSNYSYNVFGKLEGTETALGAYNNVSNENGFPKFIFHSRNPIHQEFDKHGRVIQKRFRNGRILSYRYDNYNRVISLADTHGPEFSHEYDAVGRRVKTFRYSNGVKDFAIFEYDQRDRLIASTNFSGERSEFKYDVVGVGCNIRDQVTKMVDPQGRVTRYKYDFAGRKTKETLPDGTENNFRYNLRGDLIAVLDAQGLLTQFEYDENGRLSKTIRQSSFIKKTKFGTKFSANHEVIVRSYDEADRLIGISQKLASESLVGGEYFTELTYDDLDRVIRKQITYRRNGKVVREFDDIYYEYLDLLDQNLVSRVKNRYVDLRFKYQAQPPFDLLSYSQTPTVEGENLGLTSSDFRIDPAISGPEGATYRNGIIVLKNYYNLAGRITGIYGKHLGIEHSVSILRDDLQRKIQVIHSNGLSGSYAYDEMGRITNLSWTGGSFNVSQALTYNLSGFVTKNEREFGDFEYSYNLKNEVSAFSYTGESLPTQWNSYINTTLSYDSVGNLINYRGMEYSSHNNFSFSRTGSPFSSVNRSFLPDDTGLARVFRMSGNYPVTYKYNPSGQLETVEKENPEITIKYYYDGLGRRILKKLDSDGELDDSHIKYTYRGLSNRILFAASSDSQIGEGLYVDGEGIDEHLFEISTRNGAEAYTTDYLGSVLNPDLRSEKGYGLFGEMVMSTFGQIDPLEYGFSGREYDIETELYYYRARYYDPEMARFLSKDPIGISGGDLNLYRYVGNNPVNKVDPLGMTEEDVKRAIEIVNPYIDMSNTSILYADLPGDRSGIGFPATAITSPSIVLDNRFLNELDSFQRERLLDTVHHEATHTQEPWSVIIGDLFSPQNFPGPTTERHHSIYTNSNRFSDQNAGFMNNSESINRCGY